MGDRAPGGRLILNAAFSFGRDRDLIRQFERYLDHVLVHDIRSDVDANRTWVTLSGSGAELSYALTEMCREAFERIDLQRHVGGLPRTGALDYAHLIGEAAAPVAGTMAALIGRFFDVPTFDTSEDDTWSVLHEQGFGSLLERKLAPDWGPSRTHTTLGIAGIGARSFYLTVCIDLAEPRAETAKLRAQDIRNRRMEGEAMFSGVDAIAYPAPSDGCSRMIIEFGDPDHAPPDPVLEWLVRRVKGAGLSVLAMSLIGGARRTDLLETRSIPVRPEQIVD